MTNIHHTAIVHERAKIAIDVKIGPYCIVGADVELKSGVELLSHVCVDGITVIGEGTKIFPFASIGLEPQDKKYSGEKSQTIIGKNNIIREYVTIQPGTSGDSMKTVIGDNCLFMVSSHVAHDCIVGNNVILANNATLAGHVTVGDFAILGGLSAVHQFVRIGAHSIVGGVTAVVSDVIPYGSVAGARASLIGLNLVGLKRRGFERDVMNALRNAYQIIFESDETNIDKRIEEVKKQYADSSIVMEMIDFLKSDTTRSICIPKR